MSQAPGLPGRPWQDGPSRRSISHTGTTLIPAVSSKRDIAAALQSKQLAPGKAPSTVKAPIVPEPKVPRFGKLFDRTSDCIAVGGHRGNGQNLINESGQMIPDTRENTLSSFHRAVANGATFVEFDVQVTADGIPVIWHDNYVVTGDPQAPTFRKISDITLADFKGLCSSGGFPAAQPLLRKFHKQDGTLMPNYSVWRVVNDAELPTLAELFSAIPADIGFDIEVKLTTPNDQQFTEPEEISRMTEAIIAVVQSHNAQGRTMFFSSFCPCTCKQIKKLQPAFSVMFLSDIGSVWYANAERNSLEAAIQLAVQANLDGLVVETAELKSQQDMIEVVRDQGLQLLTFGIDNNDPEWVRKQYYLGVHAAIVDELPRIGSSVWAPAVAM